MAGRLRLPSRPRGPRDEMRMTLIEHLDELRSRIIRVGIAFFGVAIVAWFFRERIFDWLLAPAGDALQGKLNVTGVTEQLFTDMKLALYVGFLLTIPVLLYQVWAFVAPAVGDMGRAFTYTIISMASALFIAGVAFGYFIVLPVGTQFLLSWDTERFDPIITAQSYLPFVTRFLLAFGIVFELPAATYVAAKLELVDAPLLKRYRKHAIILNTVLAAALTPGQDPYSMILMAVPMVVMYELSILIARYVNPTTEVTAHELARDFEDEGEELEEPAVDEADGPEQVLGETAEERLVGYPVEPGWSDPVVRRDGYPDGLWALLLEEPAATPMGAFDVGPFQPAWGLDHRHGARHLVRKTGGAQGELQPDAGPYVLRLRPAGGVDRAGASNAGSPLGEASHVEEGGEDPLRLDPGYQKARPERPVVLTHR